MWSSDALKLPAERQVREAHTEKIPNADAEERPLESAEPYRRRLAQRLQPSRVLRFSALVADYLRRPNLKALPEDPRELEAKRDKLRTELFARQDDIEMQRNMLIEQLEEQLGQRDQEQVLFNVEWALQ